MKNNSAFLVDVLKIMPQRSTCYIQAPSMENTVLMSLLADTNEKHFKSLVLTPNNKHVLTLQVMETSVLDYVHGLEIREGGKLRFTAYDGVEFGIVSKTLHLPEWFIEKHIQSSECIISTEW